MSKFKVGDRVLVKRPRDITEEPFWYVSEMDRLHERVATVVGFDADGWLRIDRERWVLNDSWCELVGPNEDHTTLTRRDHFAMAALTGVMGSGDITIELLFEDEESRRRVSVWSYELADAMEVARNKEGEA